MPFDPLCETDYIRDQIHTRRCGDRMPTRPPPKVTGNSASIEIARAPWIAKHVGSSSSTAATRRGRSRTRSSTSSSPASSTAASCSGGRASSASRCRWSASLLARPASPRPRSPRRARRGEQPAGCAFAIIPPPTGAIEPHTFMDQGGLETGGICGEFLTRATHEQDSSCPSSRSSWKPNTDATVWTFKLRPNVKFQTGQTMTADDVVATCKRAGPPRLAGAVGGRAATSSPGGVDEGRRPDGRLPPQRAGRRTSRT